VVELLVLVLLQVLKRKLQYFTSDTHKEQKPLMLR